LAKSGADDWMMVIAGPDESGERSRIRAIAQERGIADRVLFASMLRGNDRLALLRDADLFALTSRQENFGIAVVEALAAGTPVVISDQVNISDEIAEAGVGGVTTLDVDAIAAELSAWTSDPARRAAAGVRARAFALDRYDWSHIAQRWIERYASMAGTNALGRSA
jgi:glycosyltransferase involved in cell wall biosynthesis